MNRLLSMILLPALTAGVLIWLYRQKKIRKKIFIICLAGTLAGAGMMVREQLAGDSREVKEVAAGGSRMASAELEVRTDSGDRHRVTIAMPEKKYTAEEAEKILRQEAGELDSMILGKNRFPDHVEWNLTLPSVFEDTGTEVSWSSDRPDLVSWDGTLSADITEGTEVTLFAALSLEDETYTYSKKLVLYPSREDEAWNRALQDRTDELNEYSDDRSRIVLPDSLDGQHLTWYEKTKKSGALLCLLILAGAFAMVFAEREKKEFVSQKQKEELTRLYPELVCKILLLTSAGLSLRQCMRRLSGDHPEFARCCREIENGTPETEAYAHMGERIGTPEYRRLALLLAQSTRRGGRQFALQLEEESQTAFETRKRNARSAAEKMSVRMALPLMLMLSVVMIIIMVPAMMSF